MRTRLLALDTPILADALDAHGLTGTVGGIVPFGPPHRIAGRAHTVRLVTDVGAPRDRHLGTRAIEASSPGDVIVVEHLTRDDVSGWGGLLAAAAQQAGVDGVIVDGTCRDVDDYHELGFAVYARRAVPLSARGRVVEAETSEITVGGVRLSAGDWVVADRSGVVVIAAGAVAEVVETAESLASRERSMLADLRSGAKVGDVLGRTYETMLGGGGSER